MADRFGFSLGKRAAAGSAMGGFVRPGYEQSAKKAYRSEEDFFEDSDEENPQPAGQQTAGAGEGEEDDPQPAGQQTAGAGEGEEDDPLDAFMAGIQTEITKQAEKSVKPSKIIRDDIEDEDDQESYFKAMANAPIVVMDGDDIEYDYDSDGNPIAPEGAKVVDPLPPVDHSSIDYSQFAKDFYDEHESITALSAHDTKELRKTLSVRVSGYHPPKPVASFAHFGFHDSLMALIRKSEFSQPTSIQAQAIPAALSGRDVIGIAKTGSGKTAAFLWPMLIHCIDQAELQEGDGPIGLVCAPTRELCQQIYHQARKYAKAYNLSVSCVYGGSSKWEQTQSLKEGCEILVATPGRLIDLIKLKATNLLRVTYLVFDEADRMFDMGFEAQVRSIANHVRPDRQTLLFSATFRKKVERLCRDNLTDPVKVMVGSVGEANTDVTQLVTVLPQPEKKWAWLLNNMVALTSAGSVLVFVTRKADSETVAISLRQAGYQAGLLHGDMAQGDRDNVITAFKKKEFPILIATDVAARGLDITAIKTVVNYDVARNIDTHVHRIGRTGRAGEKGTAHTLVTPKDAQFAGELVRNMEAADQPVSDELLQLALQNPRFRKSRQMKGKLASGGRGRGDSFRPKQRPGLGATADMLQRPSSSSTQFTGRTSYAKEALQAQYKMRFQAASGTSFSSTSSLNPQSSSSSPSNNTKKRKSRWN